MKVPQSLAPRDLVPEISELEKKVPQSLAPRDLVPEISELETRVRVYVITATYPRLEQIAELTRLGQTLMESCCAVGVGVGGGGPLGAKFEPWTLDHLKM
jgi:hypothetical protein